MALDAQLFLVYLFLVSGNLTSLVLVEISVQALSILVLYLQVQLKVLISLLGFVFLAFQVNSIKLIVCWYKRL